MKEEYIVYCMNIDTGSGFHEPYCRPLPIETHNIFRAPDEASAKRMTEYMLTEIDDRFFDESFGETQISETKDLCLSEPESGLPSYIIGYKKVTDPVIVLTAGWHNRKGLIPPEIHGFMHIESAKFWIRKRMTDAGIKPVRTTEYSFGENEETKENLICQIIEPYRIGRYQFVC